MSDQNVAEKTETDEQVKTVRKLESLRIKPSEIKPPSQQDVAQYWCGVTNESPFQTVHAGGIDFPLFIQMQETDGDRPNRTNLTNIQEPGRLHWLTEDQVKKALDSIKHRVIRPAGTRSYMKSMRGSKNHPYKPMSGDYPLGKVVYMVRLVEGQIIPRTKPHPETLVR